MKNEKCIFLYFQYKEMKMKGLNNSLIYRPYYDKKRDKPRRIRRRKHSNQDARTTNEIDDEKEKLLENSTIKRFPISL
jgi:hypothetical protein